MKAPPEQNNDDEQTGSLSDEDETLCDGGEDQREEYVSFPPLEKRWTASLLDLKRGFWSREQWW
jgi:hypothetical protein